MSLKLRFALLFTLFVAVILLISSATIYILYFNYRRSDFYSRIKREGLSLYERYKQNQVASSISFNEVAPKYNLVDQEWAVLDSVGKTVYKGSAHIGFIPGQQQLQRIKRDEEYRAQINDRQYIGMYFPANKEYVWISAFDLYGIKRLKNIKYILAMVFFGSLLLTAGASFLFVKQAFQPLRKLSDQMGKTSDPDNAEKVQEGNTSGTDEIKQIARSYNAMIERLKRSFDLQKSFVHHASHELRTPLASMLSQTEAALNKNADAEQLRNTLKSLKEDQEDMIELTNSLLLLSQYEKLRFSEDWAVIRIDEVLDEAINAVKKIYPDARLSMSFKTDPESEEDLLVKGSDSLLRSAFFNLLKNGYAYSIDNSVDVIIENCKEHLEIYFENKGVHLTPAEQQRMFIPFFRGENAIKKKGNGLGLTIIKRIVDVHKGNINYSTAEPDINRFTIVLYKAASV